MASSSGEPSSRIFQHRSFRAYVTAQTCSSLSFQIVSLAVSWQLYAMTHSAFMLGMIGLMQFVPSVLLALPAGHLADQYNRKTLIIGGQSVEFLASLGLILLSYFTAGSAALLLSLVFVFAGAGLRRPLDDLITSCLAPCQSVVKRDGDQSGVS